MLIEPSGNDVTTGSRQIVEAGTAQHESESVAISICHKSRVLKCISILLIQASHIFDLRCMALGNCAWQLFEGGGQKKKKKKSRAKREGQRI